MNFFSRGGEWLQEKSQLSGGLLLEGGFQKKSGAAASKWVDEF